MPLGPTLMDLSILRGLGDTRSKCIDYSACLPTVPQGPSHWPEDRANHHQLDDELLPSSIGKVLYLGEKDYFKNLYVYSKKSNQ